MQNLLPKAVMPYVKAWLSLIGVVVTALVAATDVPEWVAVVGAVVSAVGVYLGKNKPVHTDLRPVEESD